MLALSLFSVVNSVLRSTSEVAQVIGRNLPARNSCKTETHIACCSFIVAITASGWLIITAADEAVYWLDGRPRLIATVSNAKRHCSVLASASASHVGRPTPSGTWVVGRFVYLYCSLG